PPWASGRPIPSSPVVASSAHSSRSKRSSVASTSLTRSAGARPSNTWAASPASASWSSLNEKSTSAPDRPELRQGELLVERHERDLDRHPDLDVLGGEGDHVGDQAHALLELHQHHRQRVVEGGDLRVVVDDEAVDGPLAAGLDRLPLQRAALGAHRSGRVPQRPAGRAALDEERALPGAIEEEGVVQVDRRAGSGCRFRLLLARPVLQDAEALGAHQLAVLVPVLGARGHEVAHTEAGGLLLRDGLDDRAGREVVAQPELPEVLLL